jgi:tRNA dimethylallyltransferase
MDRDALDRRNARRTAAMLEAGWIDETRALLERGLSPTHHCFKALGYRQIVEHIAGRIDRQALERLIALRTRQFARRQRTWFRREEPADWLRIDESDREATLGALEKLVEKPSKPLL